MGEFFTIPVASDYNGGLPVNSGTTRVWSTDIPLVGGIVRVGGGAMVFSGSLESGHFYCGKSESSVIGYTYLTSTDNLYPGMYYGRGPYQWLTAVSLYEEFSDNEYLSLLYDYLLNPPPPPSVSVPITYYPTGCVLQGPSEAEQGDTVNVLVTPGPGKVIKPESIQVYNRSGLITHTYSSGILSFDVPDGQ